MNYLSPAYFFRQSTIFAAIALLAMKVFHPSNVRADDGPAALRSRTNFDAGWRFQKGESTTFEKGMDGAKIKDAVVASSSSFLAKEGGLQISTADADLGKDVPCAKPDFDDAGWQGLNLPHDWAISGPFDQTLPGDTGKLPWKEWAGIASTSPWRRWL